MKTGKFVTSVAVLAFAGLMLGACSSDSDAAGSDASSSSATEETSASSSTTESTEAKIVAGGALQDGTYKLEEKNYSNGYRVVFDITVADGKITESNYDNINEKGDSKKDDADYESSMKDKAGVGPAEFIPSLNKSLVASQSATGVEVVTGATHSSESFQNYAQQLIQASQAGKTDTIEIDNGAALKDGTYTLEEKNYSNGYRVAFSITVAGGKITESNYDNIDKDGKSKKDDTKYESSMKDKAGIGPSEYIAKFNEDLVSAMAEKDGSPADIEVVTGATHSFHSFVIYAEQLVNAAEKGDATKIEVDNIVTE